MFYEGEAPNENQKRVCVDIMHEQGHTKQRYGDFTIQTTGMEGKKMMTQIHGEGSAFSYGRRYLTCLIFNIPTGDDDDGNAAGKKKKVEYITVDMQTEITDSIKATKTKRADFLKYIEADSIEKIPMVAYGRAIAAFKAKEHVGKQSEKEPGNKESSPGQDKEKSPEKIETNYDDEMTEKQRGDLAAMMPKEWTKDEMKAFFDWVLGKGEKTKEWAFIFIRNFDTQLKRYLKHKMLGGKSKADTFPGQEDEFDVKKAVKAAHDNDFDNMKLAMDAMELSEKLPMGIKANKDLWQKYQEIIIKSKDILK